MKVEFLSQFNRDIKKLDSAQTQRMIIRIIQAVEAASDPGAIPNLKKLKGYSNAYRIKAGDFRLGLFLEEETIVFARVMHRKEMYKYFP